MGHDHEQFVEYYHQMKEALFTYLMYRVNHDRATAEDLFMDIMLKAYEHFSDFDPEKGAFKNWIFGIAHNHVINHWRGRKEKISLEALEEEGMNPAVTLPEDNTDDHFQHQRIQSVLHLLKDMEREVIILRYINDLDFPTIARITGKNQGSVRTALSRALQNFKSLYQKFYPQTL